MILDMLRHMHRFDNHNRLSHKFKSQLQTGDRHELSQNDGKVGNGSGQRAGQSAATTKEVITREGAAVGSSYIAQGVSPVARRVDVARCGRPVSFQRRGVGDDGGLARVARAHPHGSHCNGVRGKKRKKKRLVFFLGCVFGHQK